MISGLISPKDLFDVPVSEEMVRLEKFGTVPTLYEPDRDGTARMLEVCQVVVLSVNLCDQLLRELLDLGLGKSVRYQDWIVRRTISRSLRRD